MEFKVNQVIKINGKEFKITKVEASAYFPGTFELLGTLQGDPSFLAGKRTVITQYFKPVRGGFKYDWAAK